MTRHSCSALECPAQYAHAPSTMVTRGPSGSRSRCASQIRSINPVVARSSCSDMPRVNAGKMPANARLVDYRDLSTHPVAFVLHADVWESACPVEREREGLPERHRAKGE